MPRPNKGRTILSVRVDPLTRAALGDSPSAKASDVLERWARRQRMGERGNASTPEGLRPAEVDGETGQGPDRLTAEYRADEPNAERRLSQHAQISRR